MQLAQPAFITDIEFLVVNEVASIEVKAGNPESRTVKMIIVLSPANTASSNKVIKVSEKDLPEEVVKEKFDKIKISVKKTVDCMANNGISGISLSGFSSKPKLCEAAEKGNIVEVKNLLSGGADVNIKDEKNQETALTFAIRNGHIDIAKLILDKPEFKLDRTNDDGYSVLHIACISNCPEVIPRICGDERCNTEFINQKSHRGEKSCLMLAVVRSHLECVEELAKVKGVDWKTKNRHGESLLQVGKKSDNRQIMKIIEEKLKQVAAERAVESGEIAAALIREKTNIEVKEKEINDLKENHMKLIQELQEVHSQEIKKLAKAMEESKVDHSNIIKEIRAAYQEEMDVKLKEKADHTTMQTELQTKLIKNMQCGDGLSVVKKVDITFEMAATLGNAKTNIEGMKVKVNTNIEEMKAEIIELKSRQKDQVEEFSRLKDKEIKIINEKYEDLVNEFLESNKLQITSKEKDQTENESLEKEIRLELLQSLSVPVPEEQVPECPACMEKMKPPLQIFNCPNGHLICSDCKPEVPRNLCTDCKIPYTGRANGTEKIVRRLMNLD